MAYFCYFSFGENLDFQDFLPKKIITSTTGLILFDIFTKIA